MTVDLVAQGGLQDPPFCPTLHSVQTKLMNQTVKEFFTDSEWDLIYNLVSNNREFCEDDEYDPLSDYNSILSKMHTLFN